MAGEAARTRRWRCFIAILLLTPIRIRKPIGIVIGIRIPVEPRSRVRLDRVSAQEGFALGVIVALLHVHQAGGGILFVAGVARSIAQSTVQHCSIERVTGAIVIGERNVLAPL
jgi:hypothetical protein